MDKSVREISRFYVAPPRVFPLSVRAHFRASTHLFIHKYLHLSTTELCIFVGKELREPRPKAGLTQLLTHSEFFQSRMHPKVFSYRLEERGMQMGIRFTPPLQTKPLMHHENHSRKLPSQSCSLVSKTQPI